MMNAGVLGFIGSVSIFFGGFLDYSWALHYLLGTANFPLESLEYVMVDTVVFMTVLMTCSLLSSGCLMSGLTTLGRVLALLGEIAGALAVRGILASGENVSNINAVYAGLILLGLSMILPSPSSGGSKKVNPSSYRGLYASVALLAFLFRTTQPEAQCFGQLNHVGSFEYTGQAKYLTFGAFVFEMNADGVSIKTNDASRKVVFESLPKAAFVAGALEGWFDAPNPEEMGLYDFHDDAKMFSRKQTVSSVSQSKDGQSVTLQGMLSDFEMADSNSTSKPFTMTFQAKDKDHVTFKLTSGLPRTYMIQKSKQAESIYGMGIQYSFMDLKGGCVPVFTQEQGIGRGIQPITYLVNFFVHHAAGSWQTSYAPAPYYITSEVRSSYLTSMDFALFDFSKADRIIIEVNATEAEGGLIVGANPLDVIETYTREHAGRMRPLPDWVGNGAVVGLQGGTDKVKKHVEKLKAGGVPLAGLWLQDWTGKRETDFGRRLQWNWEVSNRHYPGWFEYIEELAKEDIFVLSYINAYLADTGGRSGESTTLIQEAKALDCLVKESDGKTDQIQASATPDFTFGTVDLYNPKCQDWYIEKVIIDRMIGRNTKSFKEVHGALGFMADFAESVSMDTRFNGKIPGYKVHNDFPRKWAETCRKAINRMNDFTKENVVFFTRAGSGTSPGETTLMWMGDQMTTWDHYDGLKSALVGVLSAGVSGFSLAHSDIGGYTMFQRFGGLIKFARSPELFMRWAEMNVFSDAMFRTHEGVLPDISTQAVDDSVIGHFAKMSALHKGIYFYKKQLMKEAYETGAPLARHLFLEYPNDPYARKAKHQFMLGSELLICPIVEQGHTQRSCYVPQGEWASVYTNKLAPQEQFYTCDAPIGHPCVFYKKNSKLATELANIINNIL